MAKNLSSSFQHNSKSSSFPIKEFQGFECTCDDVDAQENKNSRELSDGQVEAQPDVEKKKKLLWQTILQESEERAAPYREWLEVREESVTDINIDSPADYLDKEIFPILLPAMEKTLRLARRWNALPVQKCRFSGLDYLAEYLWNKNPRWPRRNLDWLQVFDIPQFKLSMRLKPRPIFPKSWLWSEDEAASLIQRWVRGWLVRKREDVQELRQFWKAIKADNESLDDFATESKADSPILDLCGRYKQLAKKREKPF